MNDTKKLRHYGRKNNQPKEADVRSFLFIACMAANAFAANAQEDHTGHQQHLVESGPTSDSDIPYGTYGYLHGYLHEYGTIGDLLSKTNSSCCDGGDGGECRATEIIWKNGIPHFRHAGLWCPLSTGQQIRTDVKLPQEVSAVICAPYAVPEECPASTYCAAAAITN